MVRWLECIHLVVSGNYLERFGTEQVLPDCLYGLICLDLKPMSSWGNDCRLNRTESFWGAYAVGFAFNKHCYHFDLAASLRIDYPMLFEVHNPTTSRTSHCGVLEFVAEEGMIYMPYWVFISLLLQYYCAVFVCPVRVPYYLNVWASWSLLGVSLFP